MLSGELLVLSAPGQQEEGKALLDVQFGVRMSASSDIGACQSVRKFANTSKCHCNDPLAQCSRHLCGTPCT